MSMCHVISGYMEERRKSAIMKANLGKQKVTRKTITRTDLQTGDVPGVGVLGDVPRPRHHGQAARHRPHHLQQVQPAAGEDIGVTAGGILTLAARRSSSCSRASWRRAASARWTRCRGGPAAAPGGRCRPSPPDLDTRASN